MKWYETYDKLIKYPKKLNCTPKLPIPIKRLAVLILNQKLQCYLTSFTFTALGPLGPSTTSNVTLLFSLIGSSSPLI